MQELLRNFDISGFTRYEFKYLIDADDVEKISNFLKPHLNLDKNVDTANGNFYTVRSLYFDSPDFKCYYEKIAGLSQRAKFRLRTYDLGSKKAPTFLEIKKKNNNKGMKDRLLLSDEMMNAIKNKDYSILASNSLSATERTVLNQFFFYMNRKSYFPVVLLVYDRAPYISPHDDRIRLTFDYNLRARIFPRIEDFFEESRFEPIMGNNTILEIKFDYFIPRWISDLTTIFRLNPQSISKYCNGISHFLGYQPKKKDGLIHV